METQTRLKPFFWLSGLVALVLLAGAVVSTASAAQLSFQAAELERQQQELFAQQQLLQERLAQAQALSTVQAFAEESGFTETSAAVAQLDTVPELAQR